MGRNPIRDEDRDDFRVASVFKIPDVRAQRPFGGDKMKKTENVVY